MANLGALVIGLTGNSNIDATPTTLEQQHIYKQRLSGVTKFDGVAGTSRIIVLDEYGHHVGLIHSGADGVWELDGLPTRIENKPLIVISLDTTYTYNASIYSNILTVE